MFTSLLYMLKVTSSTCMLLLISVVTKNSSVVLFAMCRVCHRPGQQPTTVLSFSRLILRVWVRGVCLSKSCDCHVPVMCFTCRRWRSQCSYISRPLLLVSATVLPGPPAGRGGVSHAHRMCHFPTGSGGSHCSTETDPDHQ